MIYSLFQIFVFDPDLIMHYIFTPKNISQSQPKADYMIIYTYTLYHNYPLRRREPTSDEEERYTII